MLLDCVIYCAFYSILFRGAVFFRSRCIMLTVALYQRSVVTYGLLEYSCCVGVSPVAKDSLVQPSDTHTAGWQEFRCGRVWFLSAWLAYRETLAEDAADVLFRRVLHNGNHLLCYPTRTVMTSEISQTGNCIYTFVPFIVELRSVQFLLLNEYVIHCVSKNAPTLKQ